MYIQFVDKCIYSIIGCNGYQGACMFMNKNHFLLAVCIFCICPINWKFQSPFAPFITASSVFSFLNLFHPSLEISWWENKAIKVKMTYLASQFFLIYISDRSDPMNFHTSLAKMTMRMMQIQRQLYIFGILNFPELCIEFWLSRSNMTPRRWKYEIKETNR